MLIVTTYFHPHIGGVEVVAQHQARSLADVGYRVTVATTRSDSGSPHRERAEGYDVVRLPASNRVEQRSGIPYPFIGPRFCLALLGLVRNSDVVHVHDVLYQPSHVAAVLATLTGKPLLASQNTGPAHHGRWLVRRIEGLTLATAGRYVWSRALRVTAHNQLVSDHLRSRGVPAERIVRVRNGIDTEVFSPAVMMDAAGLRRQLGVPGSTPIALFVGRFVEQKGYGALLGAVGPEYHVVLAGPGTPPQRLPSGACCIGAVHRDALVDLYRLADVFVHPSIGEVFPLAVQEAMACGTPIVTTDDPRYDSFGVDRSLLRLVPAEPAALRAAILAVVTAPERRQRMSEYSRRFAVERFEWSRNQGALLRMYRAVAGDTASAGNHVCPAHGHFGRGREIV